MLYDGKGDREGFRYIKPDNYIKDGSSVYIHNGIYTGYTGVTLGQTTRKVIQDDNSYLEYLYYVVKLDKNDKEVLVLHNNLRPYKK